MLTNFPYEILIRIFGFLDYKTSAAVSETCQLFNHLVNDPDCQKSIAEKHKSQLLPHRLIKLLTICETSQNIGYKNWCFPFVRSIITAEYKDTYMQLNESIHGENSQHYLSYIDFKKMYIMTFKEKIFIKGSECIEIFEFPWSYGMQIFGFPLNIIKIIMRMIVHCLNALEKGIKIQCCIDVEHTIYRYAMDYKRPDILEIINTWDLDGVGLYISENNLYKVEECINTVINKEYLMSKAIIQERYEIVELLLIAGCRKELTCDAIDSLRHQSKESKLRYCQLFTRY